MDIASVPDKTCFNRYSGALRCHEPFGVHHPRYSTITITCEVDLLSAEIMFRLIYVEVHFASSLQLSF